jgi:hypothetical protein
LRQAVELLVVDETVALKRNVSRYGQSPGTSPLFDLNRATVPIK